MNESKNTPENAKAADAVNDAPDEPVAAPLEEAAAAHTEVESKVGPGQQGSEAAPTEKTGDAKIDAPDAAPEDEARDAPAEDEADKDETPSVEDQVAELRDRLLRAMAELENTRKRGERDREEASKYAITGFARSVLTVADNLRRAIESVPDEERENDTIKTLLDGIELTERELLKVFEQQGIKSIEPLGEKFDHNFHQAMFEVESAGQPAGTVVQVIETGYVIADRLLRPAMVGIAKATPTGEQAGETSPGIDTKV